MRRALLRRNLARISGALLLALAPFLLLGGPFGHPAHGPGQPDTPIFADARHAGEARHLEAASSIIIQVCPACLAPAQTQAPDRAAQEVRAPSASGPAPGVELDSILEPDAGGSRRPRAPPSC